MLVGIVLVVGLVVFVEQSQRRIPVQYAKRMVGRRMYGGTSTYIPIKVNMAGVIPIIFASSLLVRPGADRPVQATRRAGLGRMDHAATSSQGDTRCYMRAVLRPDHLLHATSTSAITFNPDEVADNMKKYGGFIPGIRAGRPTAEYLDYVLTRITAARARSTWPSIALHPD